MSTVKQGTDKQSTDKQSTDKQSTDKQSTDKQRTDKQSALNKCINSYEALEKKRQDSQPILGINLPKVNRAVLNVSSHTLSASDAIKKIGEFEAEQGWILYRDQLAISSKAPDNEYFIEGEWCKDQDSIRVKLIAPGKYLLSHYLFSDQTDDSSQIFTEQHVHLRSNLLANKALEANSRFATYRLWWQLDKQYKWQAQVQQFLGFCDNKEKN